MRATLHDELMHEAGFESEYQRELAQRRERRRRNLRRNVLLFASILAFVGGLAVVGDFVTWETHTRSHVPEALLLGVATAIFVGMLADLLVARMARGEGEHPRRPVFVRAVLAAVDRVWAWIASRREIEA